MQDNSLIFKYRRVAIVIIHAALISIAYFMSYILRFEFSIPGEFFTVFLRTLPLLLCVKLIVFYYFGLFVGLWRYVSMDDLWQIIKANVVSTVIFIICIVFIYGLIGFPRSVFVIDWIFSVGLISGVRFITRAMREYFKPLRYQKGEKTLIAGAGESGVMVLNELKKKASYDIVGFVDDDPRKKGMRIQGKSILGSRDDIKDIVDRFGIEQIILATPSAKGSVIRDIVSSCRIPGVKLRIVPDFYKILSGEIETKLREVKPEDLLGRETVEVDETEIKRHLEDKVILITGAAGSIGTEITKQIAGFNPKQLVLVDYNENDLYFLQRDIEDKYKNLNFNAITADINETTVLKYIFSKHKPEVVFHAAAFKHVPMMEKNPASAVKNNVLCSNNLINISEHYGVERFILISSDKAVNPTNVMGATKRISEMIMQVKSTKSKTKFIAVRFGNVLGSKGSVIPLFKKQIEEDRRITVTHPDVARFFMSTKEAVQLVLQASVIGRGGEIFILDMGEQIKIMEFAKNLITLSGLKPEEDVKIDIIGLRAGEKLYEETLHDAEKDGLTKHEKIFIAYPNEFDSHKLMKQIKELENLSISMNNMKIVEKIKEIVPSYSPNILS